MVTLPKIQTMIPERRKHLGVLQNVNYQKFPVLKANEIKVASMSLNGVNKNEKSTASILKVNPKKIEEIELQSESSQVTSNQNSTNLNSIIRKMSGLRGNQLKKATIGFKINDSNISRVSFNSESTSNQQQVASSTSISIIDNLKFKYLNNPTLERRATINKLNLFKKKCSIAIAKTTSSIDMFESNRKKKASVTFDDLADNSKSMYTNNISHFGSCLSFEGQFATLAGIDDLIRNKLNAKLDEFRTESTPRFNKKRYELINELKLNVVNNKLLDNFSPQISENNNGYQNPLRKALISKYIHEGLSLLDEINSTYKIGYYQNVDDENENGIDSKAKLQESMYSFENDFSSSNNDNNNLIDTSLRKTQEFTNKLIDWKRIWSSAF